MPRRIRDGHLYVVLIEISDENISQDLLQAGANPTSLSERGASVLHKAIYAKTKVLMRNLISAGADPLLLDGFDRSAIDWAVVDTRMLEIVRQHCKDLKPTNYLSLKFWIRRLLLLVV